MRLFHFHRIYMSKEGVHLKKKLPFIKLLASVPLVKMWNVKKGMHVVTGAGQKTNSSPHILMGDFTFLRKRWEKWNYELNSEWECWHYAGYTVGESRRFCLHVQQSCLQYKQWRIFPSLPHIVQVHYFLPSLCFPNSSDHVFFFFNCVFEIETGRDLFLSCKRSCHV